MMIRSEFVVGMLVGVGIVVSVMACTPAEKQVIKTAADVGFEACEFAYGEKPAELPPGLTLEQFCHAAENVQPFIDQILSAQHAQAIKLGTARPEVDAGR